MFVLYGLVNKRQMNASQKYKYGYTINDQTVTKSATYTHTHTGTGNVVITFTEDIWLTSIVRTIGETSTTWGFTGARNSSDVTQRIANQLSQEDAPNFTARGRNVVIDSLMTWDYAGYNGPRESDHGCSKEREHGMIKKNRKGAQYHGTQTVHSAV